MVGSLANMSSIGKMSMVPKQAQFAAAAVTLLANAGVAGCQFALAADS